jgi:phosphatidylinositol-3-phosphatase
MAIAYRSRAGVLTRGMLLWLLMLGIAGCAMSMGAASTPGGAARPLPHYDHIVIVVEENHSYADITSATDATYLASLATQGAVFTDAHGVTHPSQPNYLALFAGSTFGIASDACPQQLAGPNLASELIAHGMSFTGYSESMPAAGYTGCYDGTADQLYARKHNPWVNFADVPAASNQPFTSFPADFSQLPSVAFVVPNQLHDMHSGSIADADAWLRQRMDAYAQWALTHNSLLIVTWDEDDGSDANHIPTLFVGAHVQPGKYAETINHFDVLRTIEALEGISFTNEAAHATTIADVWQS